MPWSQDLCLRNLSTASIYYTKLLHASTSDSLSSVGTRHRYEQIASLALHLSPFSYQISTSFLGNKSPMRLSKPLPIKQKYLSTSLRDYLQINAFPDLVLVEQKK